MHAPTSRSTNRRRWARFLGAGATALLATTAATSVAGAAAPTTPPGAASGSVAALNTSSMEVQNPESGQTTVSWTSTTQFSKTVTEAVSSLSAGDCVTVTGTASKTSKTSITARTITVSTPSSAGTCAAAPGSRSTTGGTGGGFGFRTGGGAPGGPGGAFRVPSGTRPSFPGGGSSNFRKELGSIAIASGKVTGVNGSTLTVSGYDLSGGTFKRPTKSSSKSTSKPTAPKLKTETLKITTSGSTTVSSTQSAASTDLAVGDCVSAFGPAASNGSVSATTVRISPSTDGSCTGGAGGFAGGFAGGGGFGGGGGA